MADYGDVVDADIDAVRWTLSGDEHQLVATCWDADQRRLPRVDGQTIDSLEQQSARNSKLGQLVEHQR